MAAVRAQQPVAYAAALYRRRRLWVVTEVAVGDGCFGRWVSNSAVLAMVAVEAAVALAPRAAQAT
jgi:hypothetical protein